MGNPHHDRATSSSTPFFSQHQQTNLPAAQAAVAASQASATHSTPYDPGEGPRGGDTPIQTLEQIKHAQQMQEMARGMQAVGQIGGGLSGGTYTKGPVKYPKHWYTPEGLAEVRQRGWSSKLHPEFQYGGKWSITDDEADEYGRLQSLPEGVIYSSNIGDPERGYGGFRRVSNFTGGGSDGGGDYGGYWDYYGGDSGDSGGIGGGELPPKPMFQRAGPATQRLPDSWQQAMVSTHGGPEFQQGFARGGIVSLVT